MFTINVSELLLTILNFFVLFFLLRRFLFRPLIAFMEQRKSRLDAGMAQEQRALAAVEQKETLRKAQRRESREAAKRLIREGKRADAEHHARQLAQGKEDALQRRKQVQHTLEEQSGEEARLVAQQMERLAALLADRLIRCGTAQQN